MWKKDREIIPPEVAGKIDIEVHIWMQQYNSAWIFRKRPDGLVFARREIIDPEIDFLRSQGVVIGDESLRKRRWWFHFPKMVPEKVVTLAKQPFVESIHLDVLSTPLRFV